MVGRSWRRVAPEGLSGVRLSMGRSTGGDDGLSEQRKNRSCSAQQKIEIVLAALRGDRSARDLCREQAISEALFYSWLAGKEERQGERELRRKVAELERALGPKTYELEIASASTAGRT